MDSLSETSPLGRFLQLWDFIETILDEHPHLLASLFVASIYALLRGSRRNILLVLGIFSWIKRADIYASLGIFPAARYVLTALGGSCLLGLTLRFSSWIFVRHDGSVRDSSLQPHFIPCRTTHQRLFPKKHTFSYSYLLVGIPIGFEGNHQGMISVDVPSSSGLLRLSKSNKAWYDVDAVDYLSRGDGHLKLRGKLDTYLTSQGVDPSIYPHAYLVTAAKFLGYHFNPASFWYLYSKDKVLSAMVLEVNNTFGERRPYLVHRDFDAEDKSLQDAGRGIENPRARVKNSWTKDFHVSPFNSRKGTYSVVASDPLSENLECSRGIDITINLSSSKGRPKIIARLFSDGDTIYPSRMNLLKRLRFLSSWFWVGFVTFPRIVKEASVLFFQRRLHVWYRPEPLKDSLAQNADAIEQTLETASRLYLRSLVESSPSPLAVKYIPSGIPDQGQETFRSAQAKEGSCQVDSLELRVLTPIFYSRFVGYAHDVEAIFCELAESCTIWADKPDLLPKVFMKRPSPPLHAKTATDFLGFKLIRSLRERPDAIKRPMTSADGLPTKSPSVDIRDIRDFRISSMDAFILRQEDPRLKISYRSAVIRLFLANKFFFGFVGLLHMTALLADLGLAWAVASVLAMGTVKMEWPV